MSQKNKVLEYLKSGKSITPLKALTEFQAFRLADIVFKLKKDGHKIITIMKRSHSNKPYAEYHLVR